MDALVSHSTFQYLGDRSVLAAASGTCRAWLAFCAPELYHWIFVPSSRVAECIADLSKPGSHIAQHARWLSIHGPVPWSDLPKLVRLLPSLDVLRLQDRHDVYHPNLFRLTCRVLAASRVVPALTTLTLSYQTFHSAADVLRLLASLPRLLLAVLEDCSIASTPELVPRASATNVSQLRLVVRSRKAAQLAPLAQWWQWSHPAASPTNNLFPGLHITDSQAVYGIMKSLETLDHQ